MPMTNPDEAPQRLSRRHRRAPMAAINVTPFVDVMLVLLIVFMVTAPLLTVGVTVDLPTATSSPLPGQDEPLSVSVRADGQVYLQNSPLSVAELGPRLRAITERKPDARVFVRGDKVIDYGRVMEVVGAIHAAGFAKVALVTEFDDANP
ncbi:MAG: Biopolymer transport protein [Geminicoccaceae bacterium]|jgi:biopolymer transport protein TolR|nr:Biopolymer transport protein [Geminicoccaceae bacterium]MCE3248026.1 Biopolymer transport protein [Geminicoccaceae bacterium]